MVKEPRMQALRKQGSLELRQHLVLVYLFEIIKGLSVILRKYLKITETYMSANKWNEIFYPSVPSRCMLNNQYAFWRHDAERFQQYKEDVSNGRQKINSSTLYPYDLINEIDSPYEIDHAIAEAQ